VERIYEVALENIRSYWPERRRARVAEADNAFRLPEQLPNEQAPTIANAAKLLGQYYGVSLLVEVRA
jgi:hypothetical protein